MRQILLIVDVQSTFSPPNWLVAGIASVIERMPSIATVELHDEAHTPFQSQLGWRPAAQDTCLVEPDEVFVKH
ncbi:MAG TPA: hydrolase, partial [Pusillimonas sp.]|nr:hydrolase [Pusillimonas sp.]